MWRNDSQIQDGITISGGTDGRAGRQEEQINRWNIISDVLVLELKWVTWSSFYLLNGINVCIILIVYY